MHFYEEKTERERDILNENAKKKKNLALHFSEKKTKKQKKTKKTRAIVLFKLQLIEGFFKIARKLNFHTFIAALFKDFANP